MNKTNLISRNKLLKILKEKFPKAWFKLSEEFDNTILNGIWTGEGSQLDIVEKKSDNLSNDKWVLPIFNYYNECDPNNKIWINGIHKDFIKIVEEYDYFVECYDPGTYLIIPI